MDLSPYFTGKVRHYCQPQVHIQVPQVPELHILTIRSQTCCKFLRQYSFPLTTDHSPKQELLFYLPASAVL